MTPSGESSRDWPRDDPSALNGYVGKTIASVEYDTPDSDEAIIFHFTDGTGVRLRSWDYEGYSSGIYVVPLDTSDSE